MFVYHRVKDRPMGQENQSLTRSRPIVWGNHFEPRPNGLWVKSFQVQRVVKRSQSNQPRCDALFALHFFIHGKICPWYPHQIPIVSWYLGGLAEIDHFRASCVETARWLRWHTPPSRTVLPGWYSGMFWPTAGWKWSFMGNWSDDWVCI